MFKIIMTLVTASALACTKPLTLPGDRPDAAPSSCFSIEEPVIGCPAECIAILKSVPNRNVVGVLLDSTIWLPKQSWRREGERLCLFYPDDGKPHVVQAAIGCDYVPERK